MPDYQLGKIYKLVCNVTGLVYVGSTCEKTLARRLAGHKDNFKAFTYKTRKCNFVTSFKILENNNYDIVLIEQCPCNSKDELHKKERLYIESIDCVNKVLPTRSKKEYTQQNKEQMKKFRLNNKENIQKFKKEYYNKNKESIKEYYNKNKESRKEYYNKNKENIKEKLNQTFDCGCGSTCKIGEKSRHNKTLKHIKYCQILI
jgi:HD-like signal output (HDOD) protein